jgi:hypothetical protein
MSNGPNVQPPATPTVSSGLLPPAQQQQLLQAALRSTQIATFYANSFGTGLTASDISVVLICNGNPTATVIMSYPSAKALVFMLQDTINKFETSTKESVKSATELQKEIDKVMRASNVGPP